MLCFIKIPENLSGFFYITSILFHLIKKANGILIFIPITDVEAMLMADSLRLIVDPGLVRFAFVQGEPAAVPGAFPDPNYGFCFLLVVLDFYFL